MKSYLLSLLLLLSAGIAFAQQNEYQPQQPQQQKTPEQRADGQTKKMVNELGLSQQQAQKVWQVNVQTIQRMDSVKAVESLIKDYKDYCLQQILTPDQYNNYLSIEAAKHTNGGQQQQGNSNSNPQPQQQQQQGIYDGNQQPAQQQANPNGNQRWGQ